MLDFRELCIKKNVLERMQRLLTAFCKVYKMQFDPSRVLGKNFMKHTIKKKNYSPQSYSNLKLENFEARNLNWQTYQLRFYITCILWSC